MSSRLVRVLALAVTLAVMVAGPALALHGDRWAAPGTPAADHAAAQSALVRGAHSAPVVNAVVPPGLEPSLETAGAPPGWKGNQPDADQPHGWDTKCDKIADKLAIAATRLHGESAEAFARQAERWGCSSD
jgi:hypothetical protein